MDKGMQFELLFKLFRQIDKNELSTDDEKLIVDLFSRLMRRRFQHNKKLDARCFKKILFMGAGELSRERMLDLQAKFNFGLSLLSGLQQPDHSFSEREAKEAASERRTDEQRLKDIVLDIIAAFGYDSSDIILKDQEDI
jgi:hypothetical protein